MIPPVGSFCLHEPLESWSCVQTRKFALDDDGNNIFFHSFVLQGKGRDVLWVPCARPELHVWRRYVRECGGCGDVISNPWVPVCESCWDSAFPYPSWSYVLRKELRLI